VTLARLGLGGLATLVALGAVAGAARATVVFQNTGTLTGWDRLFTQHAGTNSMVMSPTYKGATAVENKQIYQGSSGGNYHSEIETYHVQRAGEDRYYGQAIYLPPDWIWHVQNVTFQQWAPDNNSGPWILMFIEGDRLFYGHHAIGRFDMAPLTQLRGTWIRIVTRIVMSSAGMLEVWLNGTKIYSRSGNYMPSGPSIRWSAGLYATVWDTDAPTGQRTLSIFHDHYRVATTYEEAEPANWDEDGSTPAPAPAPVDAATARDSGAADAGVALPAADAAAASTDQAAMPSSTGGATGGRLDARASGGAGGRANEPDASLGPGPEGGSSGGCSCRLTRARGESPGSAPLAALLVAAPLLRRGRRQRYQRCAPSERSCKRHR
jgi:hypothetical protein